MTSAPYADLEYDVVRERLGGSVVWTGDLVNLDNVQALSLHVDRGARSKVRMGIAKLPTKAKNLVD
jgi:hypothetical protein